MRASVAPTLPLAEARAGAGEGAGEGAGGTTGTAQLQAINAVEAAARNLDATIVIMTRSQGVCSKASRMRLGSRLARFAVNTRSHLALL